MNNYKLTAVELEVLKECVNDLQEIWKENYKELDKLRQITGIRSSQIIAFMAYRVMEENKNSGGRL